MNGSSRSGASWGTAALLATGAVLGAAALGHGYGPQHPREAAWYSTLRKPSFTPRGTKIGMAWGVLDLLLCVSGTRLIAAPASRARSAALACWALNVAGLVAYPWTFFKRKQLGASAAVTGGMLASAVGAVATARRVDHAAAWAGLPLVAWLGFATLLSEEVLRRN